MWPLASIFQNAGYKVFLSIIIFLLSMVVWTVLDVMTRPKRGTGLAERHAGCGCVFVVYLLGMIVAVWMDN